jgi:hypothetical protein
MRLKSIQALTLVLGLKGFVALGIKPLQYSPSALRTSKEGSHLDRKPIKLQLYGAARK